MTFVLDQRLANQGAFGVVKGIYDLDGTLLKEGEKSKIELGFINRLLQKTSCQKCNCRKSIESLLRLH
jgi:hypothetical protein